MLLKNKVAVVYGAGGAIGGAVARAFAREGATLFLTGRRRAPVEAVAKDIVAAGASAETAEVDALDEKAVEQHLRAVVDKAGRVDISFNAVGDPPSTTIGVPFIELDLERYLKPITAYATSWFLTARAAARHMAARKSGVIMTVTALPGRVATPLDCGYGPAQAAKEQLTRDLSLEFARQGIRVLSLRPHGIPESRTMREVFELKSGTMGMSSYEQFAAFLANWTHARRTTTLDDVANSAVLMASDMASGMTGTTVNLTMGGVVD
jgi:NAD(P)-dependent dehydrogenase (short-subunit alcohol dehydrogenase family)